MGVKSKALFSSVLLILAVIVVIKFNGEDHLLQTIETPQEGRFQLGSDNYCLNTLQDVINKDAEENFVIPTKGTLLGLRLDVLDCLYHRYTTSLQTYCSRQDKHGSCLRGWNICVDGCYKPTTDTVIRVISDRVGYNDTQTRSVTNAYQNTVFKYAPKFIEEDNMVQQLELKRESSPKQRTDNTFLHDVRVSEGKNDVLIIDVGNITKLVINYILENKLLKNFKQISLRTQYKDSTESRIDYVSALYQLSQFYIQGFRMYWYEMEWDCILKGNIRRTSCVTINWIHKECGNKALSNMHQHLIIPDDITLSRYNSEQQAIFYQRYLTSFQTHCKETVRLGGILDGGWEVCNDGKYRPQQSCLVYSFGINWDFKFDDAIVDAYGCEVHAFDPSMKKTDFQHSKHVSFHNIGLLDENTEHAVNTGWKLSTLKDIRENLGHLNRKLDIIKIDIEDSEWKALPNMIQSGVLRDVTQIYIEFHSIGTNIHLKILRLLYAEGFRIFWYHRNPNCCIKDKLIEYSLCNEVYFVKE